MVLIITIKVLNVMVEMVVPVVVLVVKMVHRVVQEHRDKVLMVALIRVVTNIGLVVAVVPVKLVRGVEIIRPNPTVVMVNHLIF